MIQNSRKKEGEIFIQNSLRTRGVRLEDIKILGEMSFIHYSQKKQGRGEFGSKYYTLLLQRDITSSNKKPGRISMENSRYYLT